MSLILNIDTSTELASICISDKGQCLQMLSNDTQKDHAAWLHPAVHMAMKRAGKDLRDLKAVAITKGPGSYTGLRVGMATAKGLCYALDIPLIGVNTLEAMAGIAIGEDIDYICPMIDAKRMEVYTALYDKDLRPLIPPCAMILDQNSFSHYLEQKRIIIFGNGKNKFEAIIEKKNAVFKSLIFNASHLASVTYLKFVESEFLPLAYAEPLYLKEYYTLFIK